MGLRDRLKQSVRTVLDRFSGEYSAAADEVRPPDAAGTPPPTPPPAAGEGVSVTRARLKRPRDAKESQESP